VAARMNLRDVSTEGPDYYPTPAWAVRALLSVERFAGAIHEPCCGEGNMARALSAGGYDVVASDLHRYGYGAFGVDVRNLTGPVANIVTNPPYNLASEMLPHLLAICTGKVALLLRLAFLESKRRFPMFKSAPPATVYVFSERLSMAPAGQVVNGGGTISHGWFVWDKSHRGPTVLDWIPPGFKKSGVD
jgi:hypothetical protein